MKPWLGWLVLVNMGFAALSEPWAVGTIVGMRYPNHALAVGLEGKVEIRCYIGNDGQVLKAERVSGTPELAVPAEENALKWKFRRVDSGQGTFLLVYHFEIRKVEAPNETRGFRFVMPGNVFVTAEKVNLDRGKN